MPKLYSFLFLILICLCLIIWQVFQPPTDNKEMAIPKHGLPWEIKQLENGYSQIFGLTIEKNTFADAVKLLGNDYELAIMASKNEGGSLELFYKRFNTGSFIGKLLLIGDQTEQRIETLKTQAIERKHLETGATKFVLDNQSTEILSSTIKRIIFFPTVRLTSEMIEGRFGVADETTIVDENSTYYFYPQQGLAIVINKKGKDLLQYVRPSSFHHLYNSLKKLASIEKNRHAAN